MGSGYAGKYENTYGSSASIRDNTIEVQEPKFNYGGKKTSIDENAKYVKDKYGLDDGSVITHRIITSTPDSPAVDIKIVSPSFVKPQKIHFIYESE